GIGVEAQNSGATLQLSTSYVVQNATGWTTVNGGHVFSSSASNSISGNTAGNTAPLSSPTPTPTPTPAPSPTFVAKNIVTDFGAACNGVTDDASAFVAFNSWARTQTLQVHLTIPSGSVCTFLTGQAFWWAAGIKNLLVIGYGATLTNNNQPTNS